MQQQNKNFRRGYDLLNRLPVKDIKNNLHLVSHIDPHNTNLYFSQIDTPLEIVLDTDQHREFLACDFNRVSNSYRSPYSKKYFPPLDQDEQTPQVFAELEDFANELFSAYAFLYFGDCVSSSYVFDEEGMIVVTLIHKKIGTGEFWDSIHLACIDESSKTLGIKLMSTVIMSCDRKSSSVEGGISGTVTNKINREFMVCNDKQKIIRILGSLIEESENRIRNSMEFVYLDKNRAIFDSFFPSTENNFLNSINSQ